MKLIKRHKGLAIICLLTLVLIVMLLVIFSKMFFSNNKSEYGDRLEGIVSVSSSTLEEVKGKIKDNDLVSSVTVRIQGKIIYTVITFSNEVKMDKAKEVATKSLTYYDEDVLKCYDFEFILTQEENEENAQGAFPDDGGHAASVQRGLGGNRHGIRKEQGYAGGWHHGFRSDGL